MIVRQIRIKPKIYTFYQALLEMGNTCSLDSTVDVINQLENRHQTTKISQHSALIHSSTLSKKAQFFYITPLSFKCLPEVEQESQTNFNHQNAVQAQAEAPSLLEELMTTNSKNANADPRHQRIQVQWNAFVKIKKKNYLADYIFIKEIGRGAYGYVSKIKMKYGGMLRAAKVLKATDIIKEKDKKDKLFAQISIPMKLDHPNIAKLYQVFQWKKQFALVMELCEGGDLFNYIKQNKFFSEKKAAQFMKQILSAVFYMHKNSVCHRDLKPQNMLYDTESKSLKLIDFGTATFYTKDIPMRGLVGSPYYVAPQVIKGDYDEKCDIWSCGIILYIILCGAPPFNGKTEKQILQHVKIKPLEFTNSIWNKRSGKAKQLISKMLTKDPSIRLSAEQALNSQWIIDTPIDHDGNDIQAQVIGNLKTFHFQNKLKAVVYTYIASQLYSNKDKEILLKAFKQIDKDNDGVIEKEELVAIFASHNTTLNPLQIEKILQLADTNGSGMIDFTQFLVAASNEEQLLQQERLQNAFSYLDTDHSGYITIEEVKAFLDGTEETSDEIKKIFQEVDDNGDGQISKKQFISLLIKNR